MDTFEAILTRRSIRKFKDESVDWDKVGDILEAGLAAPSAGNLQNWKFIVVQDEEKRKAIAEACLEQYWMQNAAIHIVIVSEVQKARQFYGVRGERLYAVQNCAAAAENMLIAAHSLGLGACWVGSFDEDKVRKICRVPDYVRAEAVLAIGIPNETVPPPNKYRLHDMVHLESWESKIKDPLWIMKEHAWSVENKLKRQAKKVDKKMSTLAEKTHSILDRFRSKKK